MPPCLESVMGTFLDKSYHWIKRKWKPAPRETAPMLVSNHVSYIDPIFFFYELSPTIVTSESHDSMPIVGVLIRAMQVIYVNRFSYQSRKQAVNEIKRKASGNKYPRVLLFHEGTTTNGRQLISFQLGAFLPGYPIQPVVIRYPHLHFDQSWGHIALATLMFRMFMQFHNFMEVEYLPVISPSKHFKESPARFAERTRRAMASTLNVVQTYHSFADYALLSKAVEAGMYISNFTHWFKIQIKVQDITGVVSLTLFDRDVTKLIQKTAREVIDNLNEEDDFGKYPVEINHLVEKKFAFKIEVSEFNLKNNYQVYGILKLTDDSTVMNELDKRFNIIRVKTFTVDNTTPLSKVKRKLVDIYDLECESSVRDKKLHASDYEENKFDVASKIPLLDPKVEKF
ncbi:hypothetical protein R6Q57_022674 [Mikania cordata]